MANFLSFPSKELALERRRNCKPLLIALSGCITGLIYPIFAFRHRNKDILYSYVGITAVVVIFRQFELVDPDYLTTFDSNPVVAVTDRLSNFFINTRYGPFLAHFISILLLTIGSKQDARSKFLSPLTNEKDAFPLRVRKTTSILKKIFNIDNDKAKDIYEIAKGNEDGLPLIEDLNIALNWENLEPVQFCKKEGLKIIPRKLRANLEKTPANKQNVKAKKQSSIFFKNVKTISLYIFGGIFGVLVSRIAKEFISNLISN